MTNPSPSPTSTSTTGTTRTGTTGSRTVPTAGDARTDTTAATPVRGHGVAGPVTFRRIVASELIKTRTIRSTTWALVVTSLTVLLVGTFMAVGVVVQEAPADGALDASASDPTGGSLSGIALAMYAAVAFGVLTVGGEYASGSIKVSLAAVPRRARLVWGKVTAVASVTFVVTLATTMTTFFVARAIVATDGVTLSLATPGVARAVVGAALYLTVVAMLGVGVGWLLRSTAGAVAALLAVLTLLPSLAGLLPQDVAERVLPYLPSNAGSAILQTAPTGQLDPWAGLAIFCGYAVLLLLVAARVVRRRDA